MSFEMNPKLGPFTLEELDEKANQAEIERNSKPAKAIARVLGFVQNTAKIPDNVKRNEEAVPKYGLPYTFVDMRGTKHQVYSHAQISCTSHVRGCVLIHDNDAEKTEGVRGDLIPFPDTSMSGEGSVLAFMILLLIIMIIIYNSVH